MGAQHPDAARAAQPAPKPARQGRVCSQHLGVAAGAVQGVGTRPNAPGWAPAPQGNTSALCQLLASLPHGSLVSPLGLLPSWGDCHHGCATLIPLALLVLPLRARVPPAPAGPRPRSRLQIALGNLAGLAADSCPFLLVPAAPLSTCRDAVGMCQLLVPALGEGDVTK